MFRQPGYVEKPMIKYTLKCSGKHNFDSWFQSVDAFDQLLSKGLLCCPACGDNHVEKAIMAPRIRPSRTAAVPTGAAPVPENPAGNMHALTAASSPAEEAILELKKKIQQHSDYVGTDFAKEARAIHEGEAPARSIYGEANSDEARKLVEDGVPVAPLPFTPTRKTN